MSEHIKAQEKINCNVLWMCKGFPYSSVGKESACHAGDLGLIPGLGRSPGEGNGNPLQYSFLENPMDRGARQATVYGVARVGHNLATKPPPPSMYWAILAWIQLPSKYVFLNLLTKFYVTKCILCVLSGFRYVWLFAILWTVACQAPLCMEFSKQEYWSGLPCLPPGDFPNPGIKPESPTLQEDPLSYLGSPLKCILKGIFKKTSLKITGNNAIYNNFCIAILKVLKTS